MRLHLLDQRADDVRECAATRSCFLPCAIGKAGIVRRIDEMCVGQLPRARRAPRSVRPCRNRTAECAPVLIPSAPLRRSCARVSEETMPRSERTSCSVSSARAKRLRMLRSMPGFLSSVLKKPAISSSRSRWSKKAVELFLGGGPRVGRLQAGSFESRQFRRLLAQGLRLVLVPFIAHQQHRLRDVDRGEGRIDRRRHDHVSQRHLVVVRAPALAPEQHRHLLAARNAARACHGPPAPA